MLNNNYIKIEPTRDGSNTLASERFHSTYHSIHGALQESLHVFVNEGLDFFIENQKHIPPLRIFEMGLGTGLNAALTWNFAEKNQISVFYESLEAYPIESDLAKQMGYESIHPDFLSLHQCTWNEPVALSKSFMFKKSLGIFEDYVPDENQKFHVLFYDAFAPASQPELWTQAVFEKCNQLLITGGVLSTYCSKGDVRRAMQASGFEVEKVPGPPGKREILRALKK